MMADKLFTKRLRDLTDEAIRESLAEISIEFEKRFGPAALTASPPVVEREAIARVVKGARLSAAFGREFRAGDGRLDDVDLDAADAILALPLVAADIDKAMRRASRDVIEELEAHERTLKALRATLTKGARDAG